MTHPDIVQRLREHATDWDGKQMPDLEPAKGDPTAGTLRQAADEITTLRQQLAEAREALEPFALQTALARAGRMTTQRVRRPLDDFDKARAIIAKIDATLTPGGNHG